MRNLLVLGLLLVAASTAGWYQINRQGDRTTIEINRDEIRNDARRAIDRGREFLDRRDRQYAEQQSQESGQQIADSQDPNSQYPNSPYQDWQYSGSQLPSTQDSASRQYPAWQYSQQQRDWQQQQLARQQEAWGNQQGNLNERYQYPTNQSRYDNEYSPQGQPLQR